MQHHIENSRRQLGELAAMSRQTEDMERKILARARSRLGEVQSKLKPARVAAMTGDDAAKQTYLDLIKERGQLNHVIARAQSMLGTT